MSTVRTFAQDVLATATHTTANAPYPVLCAGLAAILCRVQHAAYVNVERRYLDRGGYDAQGKYWGVGMPIYRVELDGDCFIVRAESRKALRAALKRLYPMASVGR